MDVEKVSGLLEADASSYVKGLQEAAGATKDYVGAAKELQSTAGSGIKFPEFKPFGEADIRASIGQLTGVSQALKDLETGSIGAFTGVSTSLQAVAGSVGETSAAFENARRAASALGKDIGLMAATGNVSAPALLKLGQHAATLATEVEGVGAGAGAILAVGGAAAAAGVGFLTLTTLVRNAYDELARIEARNERLEEASRKAAASLNNAVREMVFEEQISGLSDLDQKAEIAVRKITELGQSEGAAAGSIKAAAEATRQHTLLLEGYAKAAEESREANAKLTKDIRENTTKASDAERELREVLAKPIPEASTAGGIRNLKELEGEIDKAAENFRKMGKEAGLSGEFIEKAIDQARARTAEADLKIDLATNVDREKLAQALAAVGNDVTNFSHGHPVTLEADIRQAEEEIDRLRAKRDALTDADPQKVKLDADIAAAEKKLEDYKTKADNTKATVKVAADTSLAERALDALEERTKALAGEFANAMAGRGVGGVDAFTPGVDVVGGDVADPRDTVAQLQGLSGAIANAIAQGNIAVLQQTRANLEAFLREFGGGLRQELFGDFGLHGLAGNPAQGSGPRAVAIQGIFTTIAELLRQIKQGQDTIGIQQLGVAKANVDATLGVARTISSPSFGGGLLSSIDSTLRRVTGTSTAGAIR